jgi:hypothetical protein
LDGLGFMVSLDALVDRHDVMDALMMFFLVYLLIMEKKHCTDDLAFTLVRGGWYMMTHISLEGMP